MITRKLGVIWQIQSDVSLIPLKLLIDIQYQLDANQLSMPMATQSFNYSIVTNTDIRTNIWIELINDRNDSQSKISTHT